MAPSISSTSTRRTIRGRPIDDLTAQDISRRHEVEAAYGQWADALPRKPGQLGGAIVQFGVGQEIGTKVELLFDDNFLPTLRSSGIPYEAA
jgi:hypothetical protein